MHGHLASAAKANTGGLLLALMALVCGPWFLVSGLRGRWWIAIPNAWWFSIYVFLVVAVTFSQWGFRLLAA